MTTKDQQQAKSWSSEWEGRLRGLMQAVYENYPAAVKQLKPSYDARWLVAAWWRLELQGNRNMALFHRSNGSIAFGNESGASAEWKFSPSVADGLVGLAARDGSRVKIETYHSTWSGHMEDLRRGHDVVYKMVPLTGNEPVVSLAGPYNESSKQHYDCGMNQAMGVVIPFHNWVLKIVGDPWAEYDAVANLDI